MLIDVFWYICCWNIFINGTYLCPSVFTVYLCLTRSSLHCCLTPSFHQGSVRESHVSPVGPDGCWYTQWNTVCSSASTEAYCPPHCVVNFSSLNYNMNPFQKINKTLPEILLGATPWFCLGKEVHRCYNKMWQEYMFIFIPSSSMLKQLTLHNNTSAYNNRPVSKQKTAAYRLMYKLCIHCAFPNQ